VSGLGERELTRRVLQPHQNQVQIDFFGLNFGSNEALRYQYRLEGADHDWSPASTERTVNYANLAPRAYRFLVRAMVPDGAVSPAPASADFEILPPVWRRNWFLALVSVLVATGIASFDRYRTARLKEVKAALGQSQRLTAELTGQRAELREAN